MSDTLAHTFDCNCESCNAGDATAQGMNIFRKHSKAVTPVTVTVAPSVKAEPMRRLPAGQKVGRGRVRTISVKQEGFILSLIKARDTTNLHLVTGQSIDPNEIPYMGVKGASALIEKLLGCPFKGTNTPVQTVAVTNGIPATEKQINFIKTLADRKGFNLAESLTNLTKQSATRMIETLLSMNDKPRQIIAPAKTTESELSEGMYQRDGKIFKVYFNQAGSRLLAKELIDGSFEYQGMASRFVKPEHRMTIEQAKQYGKVTGTCCVCSRRLTDEESIAEGIGPVCAKKF
jgi:hypothetical protein